MGCDIHMFMEMRLRPTDEWKPHEAHVINSDGYLEQISATGRDYNLFGILANVRGGDALYEPRGVPDDCSELISKAMTDADYHSRSWLTLSEFKKCLRKAKYKNDKKSTDLFYDWRDRDWEQHPPSFTTIVHYAEQWIADELAEAILLDRSDIKPEVRLIFAFDN